MKKYLIYCNCIFIFLLFSIGIQAQSSSSSTPPSWKWAKTAGGGGEVAYWTEMGISSDAEGNIYVTGSFTGTFTFPTLPAATQLTSEGEADIFIAKYDVSGQVIWAKRAGGSKVDAANAIKYDGFGNIYVVGSFTESANFGNYILTNPLAGSVNVFIAKYDVSGNFLWAKHGAGNTYYYNGAFEVTVDNAGDAYVTGQYGGAYSGGITFAPLPTMQSAGGWDLFVIKYNSAGVAQWQTSAGSVLFGWNSEGGNGIAVDQSGNVFVTGSFNGSATNPTNFGNIQLVSSGGGGFYESNFFLAKYNPFTSSWEWAVEGGGNQNDWGKKLSMDINNNLYVDGYFEGSVTFGVTNMTSIGAHDYFLAKYSSAGQLAWIHPTGGSGAGGNSSKTDANGNFYFAGSFQGTETVGDVTLSSLGYISTYVAKWNNSGIFQWVKYIPAGYYSLIRNIEVETNGTIDIIGTLAGGETFDCTNLNSITISDLKIAKLATSSDGPDAPGVTASSNPVCAGSSTTLSITSGNLNNATAWKWYTGSCGGTLIGSGNSIIVSPSQNTTYYVRGEGGCTGPGACGSITVTINDIPPSISCPAPVTVQCASAVSAPDPGSVTATGSCGETLTATWVNDVISNQTCPNKFTITRTYQAGTGANSSSCAQIITVNDNTAPVITCPGNINVTSTSLSGAVVNYSTPTSSDYCGSVSIAQTAGLASGSTFPIGTTTNSFEATDACENKSTCSFTVTVVNPYCTENSNEAKVYVCHEGHTICISVNALQTHLNHGDQLGSCTPVTLTSSRGLNNEIQVMGFNLKVNPNPSAHSFNIITESFEQVAPVQIKVTNNYGQVIEIRNNIPSGQSVKIGEGYSPGTYFIEAIQRGQKKTICVIKLAD